MLIDIWKNTNNNVLTSSSHNIYNPSRTTSIIGLNQSVHPENYNKNKLRDSKLPDWLVLWKVSSSDINCVS